MRERVGWCVLDEGEDGVCELDEGENTLHPSIKN